MKPVRVLIVDDHEVVRVGLRTLLSRQDGINVVGEAATVTDAVAESCRLQPDVVLMDVRLSGGSGVDACRAIRDSCPATRVLFLSSYEDDEAVLAAVCRRGVRLSVETGKCRGVVASHSCRRPGAVDPRPGHYSAALDPHAVSRRRRRQASAGDSLHPAAACPRARWPRGKRIRRSAHRSN